MRKEYLYIGILIAFIMLVVWGILDFLNDDYTVEEAKKVQNIENIYETENTVTTAVQEEKISPNAEFVLKKYYDECSHFDYREAELPKELVNLTEQEVEDYYDDWEVEEFSPNKLVLTQEINGYCDQHFILKLDDDMVKIYHLTAQGKPEEYKNTDISKDYLPEEDVEKLESGIPVYGEGKLSSALEDYE